MKLTKPVQWLSGDEFIVDRLRFRADLDTYQRRTTIDQVIIIKNSYMLQQYLDFLAPHRTETIIDLGIWQGGSPVFFGLATDARKVVAIDIANPNPVLDDIIDKYDLSETLKLHFNTSQDDAARVRQIMSDEFGEEPLDLVIDDASHLYKPTKSCFETIFPRLRAGGLYIIEDWQWAHLDIPEYQSGAKWGDEAALTNFIFDLVMAQGSTPGVFSNIVVQNWFVAVQKGAVVVPEGFRLDDLIRTRGKRLSLL